MGQPHTPKVQTTSPKNGKNGLFWVRWSAIWANPETRQTRPPTTATFPRNTADKSPPQQHDVSILRLIGHVVSLGFVPCMPWYALLVRTWACYSEPGQPRPRTEQRVNVRNRRPTCETAGSHAGRVGTQVAVADSQSMTDHGAATHTGPRCSIHRNEANTTTYNSNFPTQQSQKVTLLATRFVHPPSWLTPPTTPTFPHQQAEKSPQNQYVVSYNQEPSGPTHMEGTAGSTSTPHPEPTRAAEATTKPRDSKGIPGQGAETAGFEPARGYAPLPP